MKLIILEYIELVAFPAGCCSVKPVTSFRCLSFSASPDSLATVRPSFTKSFLRLLTVLRRLRAA